MNPKIITAGFLLLVPLIFAQPAMAATVPESEQTSSSAKQTLLITLLQKIAELRAELAKIIAAESAAGMTASVANVNVEEPALLVEPMDQPASTLFITNAQSVPFTTFKLTAKGKDVLVKTITVLQNGLGNDGALSFLGDIDGGYVNAPHTDHTYVVKEDFTIKKDETREVTLYGTATYDLTSYDGQNLRLSLTGIDADAPVQGNLPIMGTFHTVNSGLSVGDITGTMGSYDPGTNKNITLASTNVIFSGVRLDIGSQEPVIIKSITWRQVGSASGDDVKNLKTIMEYRNEKREAEAVVNDDDARKFTSDFGDGLKIAKGDSVQIYIKGDVGLGVNRTIDFDIDANDNIYATGDTYGFDVAPQLADVSGTAAAEGQTSDLSYPYYNGFAHTIDGPFANITK